MSVLSCIVVQINFNNYNFFVVGNSRIWRENRTWRISYAVIFRRIISSEKKCSLYSEKICLCAHFLCTLYSSLYAIHSHNFLHRKSCIKLRLKTVLLSPRLSRLKWSTVYISHFGYTWNKHLISNHFHIFVSIPISSCFNDRTNEIFVALPYLCCHNYLNVLRMFLLQMVPEDVGAHRYIKPVSKAVYGVRKGIL
jgi:hypothetical protein